MKETRRMFGSSMEVGGHDGLAVDGCWPPAHHMRTPGGAKLKVLIDFVLRSVASASRHRATAARCRRGAVSWHGCQRSCVLPVVQLDGSYGAHPFCLFHVFFEISEYGCRRVLAVPRKPSVQASDIPRGAVIQAGQKITIFHNNSQHGESILSVNLLVQACDDVASEMLSAKDKIVLESTNWIIEATKEISVVEEE